MLRDCLKRRLMISRKAAPTVGGMQLLSTKIVEEVGLIPLDGGLTRSS